MSEPTSVEHNAAQLLMGLGILKLVNKSEISSERKEQITLFFLERLEILAMKLGVACGGSSEKIETEFAASLDRVGVISTALLAGSLNVDDYLKLFADAQ